MRTTTTRRAAAAARAKAKQQSGAKASAAEQTRGSERKDARSKATQHIEWRGKRITVFGALQTTARTAYTPLIWMCRSVFRPDRVARVRDHLDGEPRSYT